VTDSFPITQVVLRPGVIDLGWGSPDPTLLPVGEIGAASSAILREAGPSALSYGAPRGPGPLVEWLSQRLAGTRPPRPEWLVLTAGASQALDLFCTLFVEAGEIVLVEAPSYHLARKILRDHRATIVPLASGPEGPSTEELRATVAALRNAGKRCRWLYCVPTFNNPGGWSWPQACREAIVAEAAALGLTLIEDDVYRELAYSEPVAPPLADLAPEGVVVRLGAFSKVAGPGLRLGWLQAPPGITSRIVESGLLDSGGGIAHFSAMVMAELCRTGGFDAHVARMRTGLRERRDALLAALAESLPAGCRWTAPQGGYFVWLELPGDTDGTQLLPLAEAHGVSYLPGATFYPEGGGERHLRLAFSMYGPDALREAGRRLGDALRVDGAA
jgi:2-aminoadipate transaminase